VQLEAVRTMAMRRRRLQVLWEINNVDCLEGTFLDANAATDTERLRDPAHLGILRDLNTKLASPHNWAKLFAFLLALFGLALILIHNSDTQSPFVASLILALLAHRC
jgi:hypothetical protein